MAGHILQLRGCTPEPLGNYLKGLGAFRLVAEQADPQARAWWKEGYLWLYTRWGRDEITCFFLHGIGDVKAKRDHVYSPTPIFAPWGGMPPFYETSDKLPRERLQRLRAIDQDHKRFDPAKKVVEDTFALLTMRGWLTLSKAKRKKEKNDIIAACRSIWQSSSLDWYDAAVSMEDEPRYGFLFGTGGNEGRADITNIFWALIEETIGLPTPKVATNELLSASLFGDARIGGSQESAGQHFPSATGKCPNMGQEFRGSVSTNPWDVLLMMEGAVLFAGATTKRLSQYGKGKAAFPFMIDHLAVDEASTSIKDEVKQDAQVMRCRAEFWMPLWTQPTSLQGVRALLAEGKLQRASGERTEHTLHAMEAIKMLGVTRGIDAFHRVALFERRGKGYYLASSLGFHSTGQAFDLLAPRLVEIDDFLQRVYSKLREGAGVPDRVLRARQSLHTALATLLTRDEQHSTPTEEILIEILTRMAGVEREVSLLKDRGQLLNPCPALSRKWMPDDVHDPEFHLARAIAGLAAWGESSESNPPVVDAIRSNLSPVSRPNTRSKKWQWDETSRRMVWSRGASLSANLSAVLRRRLIDAQRGNGEGLPLWSASGATFTDLLAFWSGTINEERLANLIHGLALIDAGSWDQVQEETPDLRTSAVWFLEEEPRITLDLPLWLREDELRAACELPRVYHLLKLCFVGGRLPRRPVEGESARRTGDEPFPPDCLDVLSLLEAGRLAEATQLATRRLRAKGYPAVLRDVDLAALPTNLDCQRLAAMMLISVQNPGVSAALAVKPQSTNA